MKFIFCFKLYWCTSPQIFQRYFLRMEISIRSAVFFHFIAIACIRINLISLPQQSFIVETRNFTKNKLYYSLKLKTKIDSVTVFFTAIYCKGLTFCYKQNPAQPKAETDSHTDSATGSSTASFSKSLNLY